MTLQVGGILETALYVSDVKKSADFYRGLFGFGVLLETERLIALEVVGRDVLLLFLRGGTTEAFPAPGGVIPAHGRSGASSTHFAFSIAAAHFDAWREHLGSEGVAVESVVNWPQGARSLYFRDLDDNLVELITPGFWSVYS